MKLLPEFPGVAGSWQELIGDDREGSGQEISGTVLEPLGSNTSSEPLWMAEYPSPPSPIV